MKPRQNEFKTDFNCTKYAEVRRNAVRAMGFCPECSGFLEQYYKARCDNCAIKVNMRRNYAK